MIKKYHNFVKTRACIPCSASGNKGFTMIELIIVISVIAAISVIGIAAFAGRGRIAEVDAATSDVASFLQLARSRAISQVKPQDPIVCSGTLRGYRVIIDQSTGNYELEVVCESSISKISGKTLPTNLIFDSDTTSTSFLFPILTHGVEGAGIISITGYNNQKTITVDSVGGISIK
ncbi:MAG: prepilin-type N-terminal cleavage/methylation domain-containing protein [Candidatus Levyibacteriota bacterium]